MYTIVSYIYCIFLAQSVKFLFIVTYNYCPLSSDLRLLKEKKKKKKKRKDRKRKERRGEEIHADPRFYLSQN